VTITIVRYLLSTARQRREVLLACDFETACRYCLESLELFPFHRAHDLQPGSYTFVVFSHTIGPVPTSMSPESLGWVDWVTLKVIPCDGSHTRVTIETLADLNRAAFVILDRQRHSADIFVEFLELQNPDTY
jgi:hypothetical protein